MVDKNLRHLLVTDHQFWLKIFKAKLNNKSCCVQEVKDPLYPSLRLWKFHLNGIPVHSGIIRGDPDDKSLAFAFDTCFTSYVRRAFALMYGTRCGMCGSRHRHEAYWSLRMRVCRLCMEANTVSSDELCHKYGVDYSDLVVKLQGRVFYFSVCTSGSIRDDRVCMQYSTETNQLSRNFMYLFWIPDLRKLIDLPALCQQQKQRKEAALLLSTTLMRSWILHQRQLFAVKKHSSIDCLVLAMRRNEKKRLVSPYSVSAFVPGGPSWSFPERPHCGHSKFTARNEKPIPLFYRVIEYDSDLVV
jgi:hypothetical protein